VSEKNGSSGGKPDIAALRAEIKQTRAELGETVQALAAKADVKARAKESVEQTKAKVLAQAAEATGKVTGAVKGAAHAATERVRGANGRAGEPAEEGAGVRRSPVGLAVVLVGVVAAVGVILIVRGRRR
jgi:cobalamin biosynthesis Mg chelatase CobN